MFLSIDNGGAAPLAAIPTVPYADFVAALTSRRLALFALPDGRQVAILGNSKTHKIDLLATPGETFRPIPHGEDLYLTDPGAHEVAVGPVHAGVIEPGHFRFQCVGEDVHALKISLGYQHRGAEKLIVEASSDARRLALAETVAGDTSIAATIAAVRALDLPIATSTSMFNLLLELERIANHVGDLGALSGDVAYLPTASFCGRIRGEYLNMTAELVGNRFGRGAPLAPPRSPETTAKLITWFRKTEDELFHALDLLFSETGAIERFEGTGRVPTADAEKLCLVGMAGRASGLKTDSRVDFPFPDETITESLVSSAYESSGDVYSRARQRYEELKVSHRIVRRLLTTPEACSAPTAREPAPAEPHLRVAVVEAWRGELVHLAVRGENGALVDYRIVDPSVHNWAGLSRALEGEQISNFPVCNKSFNLSYCGADC